MKESTHKTLQSVQLEILHEIDRVCKENEISYWLAFGTAIGAARHGGFIPWDDDIDLFMLAEDLERLEQYQDAFAPKFFIQSRRTEPEYGLMISRVRDSSTTLIEKESVDLDINQGVFVDIYPLFNCPIDEKEHETFYRKALYARLLQYGKIPETHGTLMKIGSRILLQLSSKNKRKKTVEEIYQYMKNYEETGYLTYAYGHTGKMKFPKDYFLPEKRVSFEDMQVPVPGKNHELLTQIYGDYMQLPPVEQQVIHHDFQFVDCDNSYLNYKGKEYCVEGKK